MDAGSLVVGLTFGFAAGVFLAALVLKDRRLERPGPSNGTLASNQDPTYFEAQYQAFLHRPDSIDALAHYQRTAGQAAQQQEQPIQQNPYPGGGRTIEEAAAYWYGQTPKQQEASNQRSNEALGGLGNVQSNVVSKEG